MTLLSVKHLYVHFDTYVGKVHAVRDVSFDVKEGETIAIVGESGCGKSVTAQSIIRLHNGIIDQGEILYQGEEILHKSKKELEEIRGKEIAMIFQDPMTSLNPTMRIGMQILERTYSKVKAIELLRLVGISHPEKRIRQYPHELSGGMRQRVMIAISLAQSPKLLIADEPTTALDVTIQAQILEVLQEIQKRTKTSIILITHDMGIVAGMCDRVLVMYGGKIVERGSVDQLFKQPSHPYTEGLLRSIPRLDMDAARELIPIPGTPPQLLTPPPGCPFCARCEYAMRICQPDYPPEFNVGEAHFAACWKHDERRIRDKG